MSAASVAHNTNRSVVDYTLTHGKCLPTGNSAQAGRPTVVKAMVAGLTTRVRDVSASPVNRLLLASALLGATLPSLVAPAVRAEEAVKAEDQLLAQSYGTTRVTTPVSYEQGTGFYGTIGVGASWATNVSASGDSRTNNWVNGNAFNVVPAFSAGSIVDNLSTITVNPRVKTKFGGGFAGEAGLGYDFGDVRAELTYVYNNSPINSVSGELKPRLNLNGNQYALRTRGLAVDGGNSTNSNSVFGSLYYDIPTNSRWVPYIGGGIGYTNVSWDGVDFNNVRYTTNTVLPNLPFNSATRNSTVLDQNLWRRGSVSYGNQNVGLFGYQAKVGLTYVASCTTDVFAEGTYQGASNFEVSGFDFGSLNSWGGRIGARFRFADTCKKPVVVVKPAPKPAPAPVYVPPAEPAPEPIRGLW